MTHTLVFVNWILCYLGKTTEAMCERRQHVVTKTTTRPSHFTGIYTGDTSVLRPTSTVANVGHGLCRLQPMNWYRTSILYAVFTILFFIFSEQGETGEATKSIRAVLPASGPLPNALCMDGHPSDEHCKQRWQSGERHWAGDEPLRCDFVFNFWFKFRQKACLSVSNNN